MSTAPLRDDAQTRAEAPLVDDVRFSAFFRSCATPFVMTDASTAQVIEVNDAFVQVFGWRREELLGKTAVSLGLIDPKVRSWLVGRLDPQVNVGRGEVRMTRRDGRTVDAIATLTRMRFQGIDCMATLLVDVTAARRAREELATTVQRFEEAEHVTHRGTWEWDLTTNRAVWSKGMYRLFGVHPDSFDNTNENFLALVHPDDRPRMQAAMQAALEHPGPFVQEYRLVRPDGQVRHLHGEGDVLPGPDGTARKMYGKVRDVTDDLGRQHAALEEAQALAHVGSWEWDAATDRIHLSKEGWRLWGLVPRDDAGVRTFYDRIHPDDLPAFERLVDQAIAQGVAYDAVLRIRTPAGELHTRQRGRVMTRDGDGRPTRLAGTIQDITEHVQAEQHRIELEVARKDRDRLAQVAEFKTQVLNMVAHDLNNVVSPLRLGLGTLRVGLDKGDAAAQRQALERLDHNLGRLARFLADLLDAARLQSGKLELACRRLDASAFLEHAVGLARSEAAPRGIQVQSTIEPGLVVSADEHRLEQVLANLVGNALKFTPAGGSVRIALQRQDREACVVVQDDGVGIRAEDLSHLFQPFGKLGPAAQGRHTGSGLGLFICKGIVEQHRGRIECASDGPGRGTRFMFTLPLAD